MNFVSPEFAILLCCTIAILPWCGHRRQNLLLLAASYVFYGWWNWRYLPIMIGLSVVDSVAGLLIFSATNGRRRAYLIAALAANLLILGYFKYIDFLIGSADAILNSVGANASIPLQHVLLPIGISFHTFQSMSYTIDVYRKKIKPIKNMLDYQLFVSFFPQLVAGPIERATHLLPQVLGERVIGRPEDIRAGLNLLLLGYFKKVVIADNLAPMVDSIFSSHDHSGLAVVLGAYAFALQIYGDFSGYTDIARGIARLLGFQLIENFRQPYFATSPSDFWRRWHISLSTWLRDYLYIPLGGNRHGPLRTYFALSATMLLGGLWHGASWTFVLWGAYHGALLVIQRAMFGRQPEPLKIETALQCVARLIQCILFFQLTCFGWLIFRAQNWASLTNLLDRLFSLSDVGQWSDLSGINLKLLSACAVATLAIDLWSAWSPRVSLPGWMLGPTYALTSIVIIVLAPEGISAFIYFQF